MACHDVDWNKAIAAHLQNPRARERLNLRMGDWVEFIRRIETEDRAALCGTIMPQDADEPSLLGDDLFGPDPDPEAVGSGSSRPESDQIPSVDVRR